MLNRYINYIIEKIKNPILEMPFYEQKAVDSQLTYSNYSRLKYLLYFMSAFALVLFSLDFIYYSEWNRGNLIVLFFIADTLLVISTFVGIYVIEKNKLPSLSFQKRIINIYLILGAIWTGFLSGQDFQQNDITLIAGVFILTGGFLMKGKFHLTILISLFVSYSLMHISSHSLFHDPVTDYIIIPGTMVIAFIYGKIMYKTKLESIQQSLKLQSYSNELKQVVEKRTSELQSKNESLIKEINNKEFIQNQLISSQELFKNILYQSPDSVAIFKIGGEVIEWNSKAEEYSGIKSKDIVGRNIWDLFLRIGADNDGNSQLKSEVKKFIDQVVYNPSNASILEIKHWVTENTKSRRYIESKVFPIHLHDKTLIAILSRNITMQLENEKKLETAIQHAESANKAKSDFLANISHDLRAPLNSISGFSQILKLKSDIPKGKQLKYLNIIYDNGQYLLQLINSLIDLSKLQTGNIRVDKSEFNLGEFMQEVASLMESEKTLYAPNIELKNNCTFDGKYIISDRTKLLQVYTNLLSNAIKFTNEGSVVFECKIKDGRLETIISDTGVGMTKNQVAQIFNRFYSVKNNSNKDRKGKGLGLAIVKGYIELLKGEIQVESNKGKGTKFTFSVPVKEVVKKKNMPNKIRPPKNKKILIYDSNHESMEFTRELLDSYNLQVEELQKLESLNEKTDDYKPDLVLIDIEPNYISYNNYLNNVKKKNPELPVLAYTALPQSELPNDLSLLFDVIIFKPINTDILIQKISNHL